MWQLLSRQLWPRMPVVFQRSQSLPGYFLVLPVLCHHHLGVRVRICHRLICSPLHFYLHLDFLLMHFPLLYLDLDSHLMSFPRLLHLELDLPPNLLPSPSASRHSSGLPPRLATLPLACETPNPTSDLLFLSMCRVSLLMFGTASSS